MVAIAVKECGVTGLKIEVLMVVSTQPGRPEQYLINIFENIFHFSSGAQSIFLLGLQIIVPKFSLALDVVPFKKWKNFALDRTHPPWLLDNLCEHVTGAIGRPNISREWSDLQEELEFTVKITVTVVEGISQT
jgi:hypothetical protein